MKLYTVQIVDYPEESRFYTIDGAYSDYWTHKAYAIDELWQPKGWPERSVELYGEVKPFFWPSTKPIYRSRSAAQARADLIESYGAKAVVLVTETKWETFDERNARIAEDKREKRIADLRKQIRELEGVRP